MATDVNAQRSTQQTAPLMFRFRCGPRYQDWMARLAVHVGRSKADLVDSGLREIAKQVRFVHPPRRGE